MDLPPFNPAPSYQDAVARIAQLQTRDDETIHPESRTRLLTHGARTPRALLYLHGYTDSTKQFEQLGAQFYQRGYNVFAPRLPYHGYRDRLTQAHAQLTARALIEWTNEAVDSARGLSDALTVMGLSLGGVLATWVAQIRGDVDQVIIVAPFYNNFVIPTRIAPALAAVVLWLPNLFVWWDPRVREQAGFEYTYPRFATHTLARTLQFAAALRAAARQSPPAARSVWMITNANDFAVDNRLCRAFVQEWQKHGTNQIHIYEFPRVHAIPHDCLEPADPAAKPEIVYPVLISIVENERVDEPVA